jgi:hypothetical protein
MLLREFSVYHGPDALVSDVAAFMASYTVEMRADGRSYLHLPVWFIDQLRTKGTPAAAGRGYVLTVSDPASLVTRLSPQDPPDPESTEVEKKNYRWPFFVEEPLTVRFVFRFVEKRTIAHTYTFEPGREYRETMAIGLNSIWSHAD